jgi:hypothetical protein
MGLPLHRFNRSSEAVRRTAESSFAADAIEDAADFFEHLALPEYAHHGATPRCGIIADDLRASTRGRPRNSCGQDEAYVLLRPILLGQIDSYIGTESSQRGSVEEIDAIKAVEARAGWRSISCVKQFRTPGPHA